MSLVIPDPRWEAPELLYPGRKPTGAVNIDRNHWLFVDMDNFYYPDARAQAQDLVGSADLSVIGAIYKRGRLSFDGTNDAINANSLSTVGYYTFFAYLNVSTSDARIIDSSGAIRLILARNSSTGKLRLYYGDTWRETSIPFPLNKNVLVGLTLVPSDGTHVFVDGQSEKADAGQTSIGGSVGIFSHSSKTGNFCAGSLYYYGVTQAPLAKVQRLANNPYQFLIPA